MIIITIIVTIVITMYMFWLSIYFSNFSPRPQEKRLEAQPFPPRSLHWRWLEIQKGLLGCGCFVVFGVFSMKKNRDMSKMKNMNGKKIGFGNPYSRHTRCLSVSTTRFSNFKNNMCFISGSIVSLKDKYVSKRIQKKSWPWWLTNLWLRFFVYQCQ